MKTHTSAWIRLISSGILAILLIGILITGICGDGIPFNFSIVSWNHYRDANKYSAGNASIPADRLKKLSVDWTSGEVYIHAIDGTEIEIQEKSSDELSEDQKVHYYFHDNKLDIQYCKSGFSFSPFSNSDSIESKSLDVGIPRNLLPDLKEVTMDTVSANTRICDLTNEDLKLETDTVSGNVNFTGNCSTVHADTVSGDVTLNCQSTLSSFKGDSVSGDFLLQLPQDAAFEAHFETVSGDFNCDYEGKFQNSGSDFLCKDDDNQFNMDTVSGNITIRPAA